MPTQRARNNTDLTVNGYVTTPLTGWMVRYTVAYT